MIRRLAACGFRLIGATFLSSGIAAAMVGGAPPADPATARHVVLIVGSRGNSCSGVAIAGDLVLTAAHCVLPGAEYKLVAFDAAHQPQLKDFAAVMAHPQFDFAALSGHRATADVALAKLKAPLPAELSPAPLAGAGVRPVAAGDAFVVAGYSVTVRGDGRTGGTVRAAVLVTTGEPGTLQIRLYDPATKGERPGLGACTADFRRARIRTRRTPRRDRPRKLVHRSETLRRLRRPHRRHPACPLPRLDRGNSGEARLGAGSVTAKRRHALGIDGGPVWRYPGGRKELFGTLYASSRTC
jgi:hypothetical protein